MGLSLHRSSVRPSPCSLAQGGPPPPDVTGPKLCNTPSVPCHPLAATPRNHFPAAKLGPIQSRNPRTVPQGIPPPLPL